MKQKLITLAGLLISGTILAQDGGTIMKKYENQLPQEGRGNVHVAYQGKAIDQMIYEFMEEQGQRYGCGAEECGSFLILDAVIKAYAKFTQFSEK